MTSAQVTYQSIRPAHHLNLVMTKTPFVRKQTSFEVDEADDFEEGEGEDEEGEETEETSGGNHIQNGGGNRGNSEEIKRARAQPVNKNTNQVYADHSPTHHPPKGLKRYKILSLIGDGTYGLVYMATNIESREKVAIKAMKRKYHSWDEVMDLREVKSLKKLHHPNVVKLKEVIRENSRLYFVFEYVKGDLLGLMREKAEPFPEFWIRSVIMQVLQGLAYMHRLGFFHRDLKPENILATGPDVVKIADFGLVREIRSSPPYTDYVSTRWYRAPEVLLRSTNYNSPIDIWAVGCITSELYTKRPLFPGTSEIDQLYKIASVMGTPGRNDWPDGFALANSMSFRFPNFQPTHLSSVLGHRSSARAVSFLYALLQWNPAWRSSAQEALKHSFFRMGGAKNPEGAAGAQNGAAQVNGSAMGGLFAPDEADISALSLRPRNAEGQGADLSKAQQLTGARVALPLTEIEPHFSRDLGRQALKSKGEERSQDSSIERPRTPPPPAEQELPPDDDLNDLISAFSLGRGTTTTTNNAPKGRPYLSKQNNKKSPLDFLLDSPVTRKFDSPKNGYKISPKHQAATTTATATWGGKMGLASNGLNGLTGSSTSYANSPKHAAKMAVLAKTSYANPATDSPKNAAKLAILAASHPRGGMGRRADLANMARNFPYGSLNFSPTATKFTLLYGHHQPPAAAAIKIVSPSKLGIATAKEEMVGQNGHAGLSEVMGKRMNGLNRHLAPHTGKYVATSGQTMKKDKGQFGQIGQYGQNSAKVLIETINVNGKGLAEVSAEKPKIHVRPDWAAKYLK